MPNETNPNDPVKIWQNQEVEKVTLTLEELRHNAVRFQRRVHWRNLREYAAGVLVIAFLAPRLWSDHGWRAVPAWLMAAGTLYVMYQIYRRGGRPVPADAGLSASLEFHRRELERQRDALRSVWRWYLLPLVPGLAAVLLVTGMERGFDVRIVLLALAFAAVFGGVWLLNQWGARKLDRKVEELRVMETDGE